MIAAKIINNYEKLPKMTNILNFLNRIAAKSANAWPGVAQFIPSTVDSIIPT